MPAATGRLGSSPGRQPRDVVHARRPSEPRALRACSVACDETGQGVGLISGGRNAGTQSRQRPILATDSDG